MYINVPYVVLALTMLKNLESFFDDRRLFELRLILFGLIETVPMKSVLEIATKHAITFDYPAADYMHAVIVLPPQCVEIFIYKQLLTIRRNCIFVLVFFSVENG